VVVAAMLVDEVVIAVVTGMEVETIVEEEVRVEGAPRVEDVMLEVLLLVVGGACVEVAVLDLVLVDTGAWVVVVVVVAVVVLSIEVVEVTTVEDFLQIGVISERE
jgi:hypothetical protein